MTTTKTYDKLNRLAGMTSTPSGGGQLPFSYGANYNEANQRTQTTLNDESYWVYDYDTLGQISSAKKHFADGAFVPGQQFFFSFDHIGNRTTDALPTESVGWRPRAMLWVCSAYLRLAASCRGQKKMIHASENTNASDLSLQKICANLRHLRLKHTSGTSTRKVE